MNAVEHLAGLFHQTRGSGAQAVDDAAAGAVEAGQAEHLQRQPHALGAVQPVPLDPSAAGALQRGGVERIALEGPAAGPVAVDGGGGGIADPVGPGVARQRRQGAQGRAAVGVGRRGDQNGLCGGQRRAQGLGVGRGDRRDPLRRQRLTGLRIARGGEGRTAAAQGLARRGLSQIAAAEHEQGRRGGAFDHRASIFQADRTRTGEGAEVVSASSRRASARPEFQAVTHGILARSARSA